MRIIEEIGIEVVDFSDWEFDEHGHLLWDADTHGELGSRFENIQVYADVTTDGEYTILAFRAGDTIFGPTTKRELLNIFAEIDAADFMEEEHSDEELEALEDTYGIPEIASDAEELELIEGDEPDDEALRELERLEAEEALQEVK